MPLERKHAWLALGCVLIGASESSASATEPAAQWGGFYVGGQLGGAWSNADWDYTNNNWFNTLGPVRVIQSFDMDGGGFLAGGQAGFNYQTEQWVLGIEASLAGTGLRDSVRSPFFPTLDVYTMELDLLTTVTGRAGYSFGRWLAYAEAGWAGAEVDLTLFDRVTTVRASSETWANGWTVGGGFEYALRTSLSLGLGYDYVELDADPGGLRCPTCPSGLGGGVPAVDGDVTVQSLTARLNYRFGR